MVPGVTLGWISRDLKSSDESLGFGLVQGDNLHLGNESPNPYLEERGIRQLLNAVQATHCYSVLSNACELRSHKVQSVRAQKSSNL